MCSQWSVELRSGFFAGSLFYSNLGKQCLHGPLFVLCWNRFGTLSSSEGICNSAIMPFYTRVWFRLCGDRLGEEPT